MITLIEDILNNEIIECKVGKKNAELAETGEVGNAYM
jgi:hypothetical protein